MRISGRIQIILTFGVALVSEASAGPRARPGIPPAPDPLPACTPTSQPATAAPDHDHHPSWLAGPQATGDWFGGRTALRDAGVSFDLSYTSDWSQNWRGGLRTRGAVYRQLWQLGVSIDTEPLLGWPGGTLYARYDVLTGRDGTKVLVGDFQRFSSIDGPPRSELYTIWYDQRVLDGRLALRLGKLDANESFAQVRSGADFNQASFGYSPTILYMPTYIDPAMGATLFVHPTDWLYAGAGAFDGSLLAGVPTGELGPQSLFNGLYFYIGEVGATWGGPARPGRLAAGAWHHTGVFERFEVYRRNGPRQQQDGTGGFYLLFDQRIWKEDAGDPQDQQGLGVFAQYGWADQDVAPANHYVGAGMAWTGLLPGRDHDVLGLGAAYAHFSSLELAGFTKDYECAVEFFYKFQITPSISLKPDIQYILNPGGQGLRDAVVGTLRIEIDF